MVRPNLDGTRSVPTYAEPLGSTTDLKVSELPRAHRPREKMIRDGPRALSHVELLAVILGTGTRKDNVLKIAERLLKKHRLATLPGVTVREWTTSPGVGASHASPEYHADPSSGGSPPRDHPPGPRVHPRP